MLRSWPFALIAGWSLVLLYATFQTQISVAAWRLTGPDPFTAERVWEVDAADSGTRIIATFRKKAGCELFSFRVLGIWSVGGVDQTAYLPFTDLDGLSDNFDREPGSQTLRIIAEHGREPRPSFIEMRTLHDCGGPILTPRVFARVAVP